MINYSIVMRKNPQNKEAAPKAYASAQYAGVMDLNKFAAHIASHGSVYSRADIAAVLTLAVDCIHEQLLAGQKIELGDLGAFSVTLHTKGAKSAEEFNPEVHVKRVKARWEMGDKFLNLTKEAEFNLVANRKQQAAVLKAVRSGETSVDLTTGTTSGGSSTEGDGGNTSGSGNGDESNPL